MKKSDQEWKQELSPESYAVCRCSATERPFSGKYWNHHERGVYICVACKQPLFSSKDKFDSGTGWPSFTQPLSKQALTSRPDECRTEILCSRCQSHLGHVFEDGPKPTGMRYCINSAALDFEQETNLSPNS